MCDITTKTDTPCDSDPTRIQFLDLQLRWLHMQIGTEKSHVETERRLLLQLNEEFRRSEKLLDELRIAAQAVATVLKMLSPKDSDADEEPSF